MADGTQSPGVELELDPEVIVARVQGRRGWEREAQHQLEEHRRVQADPIPRSRSARLLEAERRLAENLAVEREANEAYEHHRATAVTSDGRRFGARPNPYEPPDTPPGRINMTDLDSRNVKTPRSYTQGYNAQAVVNEHQVVLAAEVTSAHRTSDTYNRWSKPPTRSWRRSASARLPGSRSPTAATGTSSRWTTSSVAAPAC